MDRIKRFFLKFLAWAVALGGLSFYLFAATVIMLFLPGLQPVMLSLLVGLATIAVCGLCVHKKWLGISAPEPSPHLKSEVPTWAAIFAVSGILIGGISVFISSRILDPGMDVRMEQIEEFNAVLFLADALFFAPFVEEILMRQFFHGALRTRCSMATSVIASSVVFSLIHLTLAHLITATVLGVVLVCSYEATGSKWTSIIGHMIYNFTISLVLPLSGIYAVFDWIPAVTAACVGLAVLLFICFHKAGFLKCLPKGGTSSAAEGGAC